MMPRMIYTIFIGVLFAILVGVGIAAFYQSPKPPDQPAILKYCSLEITQAATKYADFTKQATTYDKEVKAFESKIGTYNKNVSIIAIICAILTLIASLILVKRIQLIADGLLLGGVLTLLYAIMVGFGSGDDTFRFLIVAIGFVVSLILGYLKFIKTKTTT